MQRQQGNPSVGPTHGLEAAVGKQEGPVVDRRHRRFRVDDVSIEQHGGSFKHWEKDTPCDLGLVDRRENVSHRIEQGVVRLDQHAPHAHGGGGVQVALLVADHPRLRRIELVLRAGPLHHQAPGLAAQRPAGGGVVRAVIDVEQGRPVFLAFLAQKRVNLCDVFMGVKSLGEPTLVGDEHHFEPGVARTL